METKDECCVITFSLLFLFDKHSYESGVTDLEIEQLHKKQLLLFLFSKLCGTIRATEKQGPKIRYSTIERKNMRVFREWYSGL